MPVEGEDELQDLPSGGENPGASSGMGWNANPAQQPPNPYQPSAQPYQPPMQPFQPPAFNYQPDPLAPGNNASLPFILPDPPKDPEPKHPGGFIPYNPSTSNIPVPNEAGRSGSSITPEQIAKAQKYCKYVASALTYDDVKTAIENLQKCLRLLQTGEDS